MQIELQLGVVSPGKNLALIISPVHDDPVEAEPHDTIEQDLRNEDEESEAALGPG